MLAIGITAVVVTGGAALPALAGLLAGTVSAGTALVTLGTVVAGTAAFAFGAADMMEAFQDLRYGMWGSSKTSINPLRDTLFAGNGDLYYGMEMLTTLLASAGTATFRSFNMESEIDASKMAGYGKGNVRASMRSTDRGSRGNRFPENPDDLFPENYAGVEKEITSNGKINYTVQAADKIYKIEYHLQHEGEGHYNGNHYHVLKLGEYPKPGKTKPPYFRIPNLDPDSPAQGGTFAPGDLLPTKNN